MTPTTAYLLGRELDAAYRYILDGRPGTADIHLKSARERLDRATKDGVKDHDAPFVAGLYAEIEEYAAQSAALKGGK